MELKQQVGIQSFAFKLPATARLRDAVSSESFSADDIVSGMIQWQQTLSALSATRILFKAQSSVQWALLDLACLHANILLVPVPAYLSEAQWQHVMMQVKPDLIITDELLSAHVGLSAQLDLDWTQSHGGFQLYQVGYHIDPQIDVVIPQGTQKITFTSGSTGNPKGVCLSAASQLQVAASLVERIKLHSPRHLCLLPLPTLLENIAGVYAPLLAGGEVLIAPEAARGLNGSRLENPRLLLGLISQVQPETLILVPELLQLLVHACLQGWQAPASLKFIAVGGAKVAVDLLKQAALCGLPVYQGYGLSECCSVVALSDQSALQAVQDQLQQVGKVLPHLSVKIVNDEICVKTPFLGYLGDDGTVQEEWVATGDLGSLTEDGYLTVWGRKKNLLILSSGRNVNPEWVEAELVKTGLVQQAVLFGDAKPYCVALLYCANPAISDAQLTAFVSGVNQLLPDYARAERFIRLAAPLSEQQNTYTANGRPKRAQIAALYATELASLYPVEMLHASANAQPLAQPIAQPFAQTSREPFATAKSEPAVVIQTQSEEYPV
jgi:long-subunit acyl-CoA synthetase (AMP-forming)